MFHQNEYEWVRQTRRTLLDFCRELEVSDFIRVRELLVHITDCYIAWLGSFVLLKTKEPLIPKEDLEKFNLDQIKLRFEQVDFIVYEVFKLHENQLNEPIQRKIPWRAVPETAFLTPGKLLMHTMTHEFHHKGQIVAIIREMGYIPPNTDILGTVD